MGVEGGLVCGQGRNETGPYRCRPVHQVPNRRIGNAVDQFLVTLQPDASGAQPVQALNRLLGMKVEVGDLALEPGIRGLTENDDGNSLSVLASAVRAWPGLAAR
jgi:hypothetical protein